MSHTKLVDERCEVMIERGLLEETTQLQLAGQLPDMAARAIGYRQTLEYLQRENSQDHDETAFQEYLNQFTTVTRQYSKKQIADLVSKKLKVAMEKEQKAETNASNAAIVAALEQAINTSAKASSGKPNQVTLDVNSIQGIIARAKNGKSDKSE